MLQCAIEWNSFSMQHLTHIGTTCDVGNKRNTLSMPFKMDFIAKEKKNMLCKLWRWNYLLIFILGKIRNKKTQVINHVWSKE